MKQSLSLVLFAAAAIVAGTTFAQAPQGQSSDIAALRRSVARLEAQVAALEAQAADEEQVDEIDEILAYLEKQAQAGSQLQGTLAEADKQGFTWGVNPNAHELVLNGIDTLAGSLQQGLPERKAKGEEEPRGGRR